ncbi:SRPBCC family protein [Amycolatopsis sp. WQ 127309]|uniref:SRPBCC family protein n=1 Tax=Amycolatopsis sp. WQ 127309 TaxID=2932773 RepID=UPI001FF58641|nr:SRPBCC family protein [Amycolatopsis sp. WQ 127309]UOZ04916.1 SRPBCC family protein [Amycolatopsis sp. WQ 127309]
MTEVSRMVDAPPESVFAVLADGWSYGGWVVGSSHIRVVDEDWPAVGARIHHSVGLWPLQIEDESTVVVMEPDQLLLLHAKAWLFGTAAVEIALLPRDGGTRTLVRMREHAVRGPGKLLPERVQGWLLRPRNKESLARLADIAVGRRATSRS